MLSPLLHLTIGLLRNSAGGGGGRWAVGIHTVQWTIYPELLILSNSMSKGVHIVLQIIDPDSFIPNNRTSKGQILSYSTHTWSYIYMTNLTTYSMLPPYLGGRVGEILHRSCSPPPIFRAGWGWGCGWLGPSFSLVFSKMTASSTKIPLTDILTNMLRPILHAK